MHRSAILLLLSMMTSSSCQSSSVEKMIGTYTTPSSRYRDLSTVGPMARVCCFLLRLLHTPGQEMRQSQANGDWKAWDKGSNQASKHSALFNCYVLGRHDQENVTLLMEQQQTCGYDHVPMGLVPFIHQTQTSKPSHLGSRLILQRLPPFYGKL